MKGGGPEFFQTHLERVQKYKYAFITWLGYFMGAVQLVHPEPIKAVLKGSDPKSYIYKQSLIDWLGKCKHQYWLFSIADTHILVR